MGLFDGTPLERPILCERCNLKMQECRCGTLDTPPGKQTLQLRLEKRKKGKLVTVIADFQCSISQLQDTLSGLQSQCGAGGVIGESESSIELQGDHLARVPGLLRERGYRIAGHKT